ncbi:MAG: MarR family transcriptional regulator [Bacteroidota bacterium]
MNLVENKAANPELAKLEKNLYDLADIYRKHQTYIKTKYKISALDMEILQLVIVEGPKKMKEIGEHFQVKLSTLTSIIDKIERKRLVKRVNSRHDRRVVHLAASPKGKQVYTDYSNHIQLIAKMLQTSLDDQQLSALLEGLDRLSQLVNADD